MTATHLHPNARTLAAWAHTHAGIRAGFWYGGFGYGQVWPESDLDLALLLRRECDPAALAEALVGALHADGHGPRHWCMLRDERRIAVWVGAGPTRVDVVFGHHPSELAWLADAVDVPAPRLTPAWPVAERDDDVRSLLLRASVEHDPLDAGARRARAEAEIDKFLLAFDQCSSAHARSDAYAFYFHYNLALGRLMRVVQLVRAGLRHLYLPRNPLAGLMPVAEQLEYRGLAGTLYLPEALDRKRALAERFLAMVDEAREALGVAHDTVALRELLERVQRRDLFFNVRDVAVSFPGQVVAGRLFRASALARWSSRAELVDWLDASGVTDIIDLRNAGECERMPYSDGVRSRVRVHSIPVPGPPADDLPDAAFVERFRQSGEEMRRIVEVLGSARGAVVIHCHVGRDRTGWICALVQCALGLPREAIVRDYLASRMETRAEVIEALLSELDRAGGPEGLLRGMGVAPGAMEALRARLLSPVAPSAIA
jgi:protein-tyrosine phosphatase